MSDFLQVEDQYYVLATSLLADHDSRILKQGETFGIYDPYGDIQPVTHPESGVFYRGTRHLSRYELKVFENQRPLLLNSTLRDDNGLLKVDMTTRDVRLPCSDGTSHFLQKGTLYIDREKFLQTSGCEERVGIANYGEVEIELEMSYSIGADFADVFEVRGTKRKERGHLKETVRESGRVVFTYVGLDGIERKTLVSLSLKDFDFDGERLSFRLKVAPHATVHFTSSISFVQDEAGAAREPYDSNLRRCLANHEKGRSDYCRVRTSSEQFDTWMRRSTDDLVMMTTETVEGPRYPYAGIPWFCTPFGRDGIITAMQCLWANPSLAKGVLEFLAATQAVERVAEQDSTPGKIIHEIRDGEMARLKEIPFGRYYGSIDSTPLFVALGGQYLKRTADEETIRHLWPAFEKAIFWLDRYGDPDGDGFIEYQRENPHGLIQQGWKDSHDSIFHKDGRDAKAPIALCEVQGYAYMAKLEGAKMAERVGHLDLAKNLRKSAEELKENFDHAFWLDDLGTYAIALDGEKRPCRVKSSNAGQCLFTGIAKEERAAALVKTLMDPDSFSGWGVRTIAKGQARYNPMSYHNGSVWPHDSSLVAWGMAKYGFTSEAEILFNAMGRAANYMELARLPEVFCGFNRREGEAPTLYPHACSPQAWAAGAVYMMVQAMLGLEIDALEKTVTFCRPRLTPGIHQMKINALEVADRKIDVIVENYQTDVSVRLAKWEPGLRVVVVK